MPAPQLAFVPVTQDLCNLVSVWLADDTKGKRHIGHYDHVDAWWNLLDHGKDRYGWIVYREELAIGFFDIEVIGQTGYFTFYIRSEYRRHGYGSELLKLAKKIVRPLRVMRLEAAVEEGNLESIGALSKAGFAIDRRDSDGLLRYVLKLSS